MSPLGVELVGIPSSSLPKGTSVDLELIVAGQRSLFEGLVVDAIQGHGEEEILGVRLAKKLSTTPAQGDRRTGERWLCSDEFLPTGIAPTPGRFDDFIYFQIRDISADGLQLTCSLRNKFLIPGMRIGLTAVFPMAQVAQLDLEVVRVGIVSIGGRDRLVVGARFVRIGDFARGVLGQYIVQFGNVESLEELRAASLIPRKVSLGVDFYNLKSEEDYRMVLELRYLAHAKDENLREGARVEDLADINDARSRIIVGKYRGRIVATARVRFNNMDEPLEHEAYVSWPKELPRRDQIIEVSRVATHPDFRRSDLLAAMLRYTYLSVVQGDRQWVVMSCLDHMIPFYSKLGFSTTGIRHTEPHWRDDRVLNIMIANVFDMILGRGVSPLYWVAVYKDLADHFRRNGLVEIAGIDRIRTSIFGLLSPFMDLIARYRRLKVFGRRHGKTS